MDEFSLIIAEAKAQYGEAFRVDVEDDVYIFRLLTRKEYADVLSLTDDQSFQDEIICQLAVIYPEGQKFSAGPAGIPQLLAPIIITESGFGSLKKADMYFDKHREEMELSFEKQAEAMIQAAFPQIQEEEMQNWTVSKFMEKTAKAEWILKNVMGFPVGFKREEPAEGQEAPPEPTAKEVGNDLRRDGLDPMIELAPYILKPRPFAEFPFIAGTEYWKRVSK